MTTPGNHRRSRAKRRVACRHLNRRRKACADRCDRGASHATSPGVGVPNPLGRHAANGVGRPPRGRAEAPRSPTVGGPFPQEDRAVLRRKPDREVHGGRAVRRVPRIPSPRRKRLPDAGDARVHLRHLGRPGTSRQGGREIAGRMGRRVGTEARSSEDQARGRRDERPRAARLREPRLPSRAPLHGQEPRVARGGRSPGVELRAKGLYNAPILVRATGPNMFNVTLSDNAVHKLRDLIGQHGTSDTTYLRMYVAGGGCSGFRYGMALDNKLHEGDEVLEANGIKVVADPNSVQYLDGSSVDYTESVAGSGFVVSNPNNWSTCGCGQSFSPKGEGAPDETDAHQHAHAHTH